MPYETDDFYRVTTDARGCFGYGGPPIGSYVHWEDHLGSGRKNKELGWRLHQPSDEDAGSSVEHTLTILFCTISIDKKTYASAAQCDTVECYWSTAFKREGVEGGASQTAS
uniref:Uncharacterized protein n=1 Tax=Timema cristinae TaxID=61476 RepID=A0A7R9CG05_TIMCR|nr:unnamed protein product [Timema cristinae]